MASLTVRNISVTPLELTRVERFAFDSTPTHDGVPGGGFVGRLFWGLVRAPMSYLRSAGSCGDSGSDVGGVALKARRGDAAPFLGREEIQDVHVGPFATRMTDVRAPDPEHEVLRLTFAAAFDRPGAGNGVDGGQEAPATTYRYYTVDVPAASARSIELQPVDDDDDDEYDEGGRMVDGPVAAAAAAAFTAVYIPHGAHLAIMSSAALSSWMATVDGAWPLSSLSLPGTHNSPACHAALPSVRCQAVDVRTQLDNGARFLDVRVSVNPTRLGRVSGGGGGGATAPRMALVHSAFSVSLTSTRWFAELYAAVCAFLDAHPTETVLLSVKREGTGWGTDADLARQLLEYYTGGRPDRPSSSSSSAAAAAPTPTGKAEPWRWFTEPRIPRLDEVRGRIVLVRRFRLPDNDATFRQLHGGAGWGLDASTWPDNCADGLSGSGLLRLQDFYEVTQAVNIDTKIRHVRALLEHAASTNFAKHDAAVVRTTAMYDGTAAAAAPSSHTPPLFLNFLSGSNFFNASCWPERIAARVNPAVIEYLCMRHGETAGGPAGMAVGDGSTGIVVTDWVGAKGDWDLIRCIVAWNARLQLKP
ncbi:phosphatidylinositol phospholipase c [Niveomyces insectorum RCEF 264]|uniref:Phosphatidylinositol phospholipase c n=1 Tax=Niveomyces insectorum RCEF 264 TaxID=1081102 RepID=A0A167XVS7_9HYPO|nr:phosphatidylinositol phospholipase c [Niveomyces insectorum RCEF 264]